MNRDREWLAAADCPQRIRELTRALEETQLAATAFGKACIAASRDICAWAEAMQVFLANIRFGSKK